LGILCCGSRRVPPASLPIRPWPAGITPATGIAACGSRPERRWWPRTDFSSEIGAQLFFGAWPRRPSGYRSSHINCFSTERVIAADLHQSPPSITERRKPGGWCTDFKFRASSEFAATGKESSTMSTTFNDWIMQAQITDDPAGDFIDDMRMVIRANRHPLPEISNMDQLRSYLYLRGACHEAIATVPVVWKRYRTSSGYS
jgi:hypothetical protein